MNLLIVLNKNNKKSLKMKIKLYSNNTLTARCYPVIKDPSLYPLRDEMIRAGLIRSGIILTSEELSQVSPFMQKQYTGLTVVNIESDRDGYFSLDKAAMYIKLVLSMRIYTDLLVSEFFQPGREAKCLDDEGNISYDALKTFLSKIPLNYLSNNQIFDGIVNLINSHEFGVDPREVIKETIVDAGMVKDFGDIYSRANHQEKAHMALSHFVEDDQMFNLLINQLNYDINVGDKLNLSLLNQYICLGDHAKVEYLLAHGARTDIYTPAMDQPSIKPSIFYAVEKNDLEMVRLLVRQNPEQCNYVFEGKNAISYAIGVGANFNIFELLSEYSEVLDFQFSFEEAVFTPKLHCIPQAATEKYHEVLNTYIKYVTYFTQYHEEKVDLMKIDKIEDGLVSQMYNYIHFASINAPEVAVANQCMAGNVVVVVQDQVPMVGGAGYFEVDEDF